MRTITQASSKRPHCDVFEDLVNTAGIKYDQPLPPADKVDEWTRKILTMVTSWGVELAMGDVEIYDAEYDAPPSRSFRVLTEGAPMKYVEIYPISEQFMYIEDEWHHNGMHPDRVLAWAFNGRVEFPADDTSIVTVGDVSVVEKRSREGMNTTKACSWPKRNLN